MSERPQGCCREEICECLNKARDRLQSELTRLRAENEQLRDSLGDALALIETITPIEGDTVRKCRAVLEPTK